MPKEKYTYSKPLEPLYLENPLEKKALSAFYKDPVFEDDSGVNDWYYGRSKIGPCLEGGQYEIPDYRYST